MKVIRCIAEAEILGAERNTFQYVTHVVISSEKIHVRTCKCTQVHTQTHKHTHTHTGNQTKDWFTCGFTFHSTQNRSFRRRSSQPISYLSTEKLKQTQQKQTCIYNKIYYNIKLTQKPKARFYCLLWNPTWKRRGPILVLALHKFVTYLLTHLMTYLQPRDPNGAIKQTDSITMAHIVLYKSVVLVTTKTNRAIFSCPDVKWQQMKQKLVPLNMNETAAAPLLPSNHTTHFSLARLNQNW